MDKGKEMHKWIKDLFPICRSICGPGFNQSLNYLKSLNLKLRIIKFPSGSKVFDWQIPKEWHVKDVYILNTKGKKFAEFKKNNLHLVSFSEPVHKLKKYLLIEITVKQSLILQVTTKKIGSFVC